MSKTSSATDAQTQPTRALHSAKSLGVFDDGGASVVVPQ